MSDYANTVKDVSRAIAVLDENACNDGAGDAVARVASNLAYQFARHYGTYGKPGARRDVSTRDVRAALIAHGASVMTVELFARRIAHRIRNDFSDGWNYHAGEVRPQYSRTEEMSLTERGREA